MQIRHPVAAGQNVMMKLLFILTTSSNSPPEIVLQQSLNTNARPGRYGALGHVVQVPGQIKVEPSAEHLSELKA
jgi:hypothetical protein